MKDRTRYVSATFTRKQERKFMANLGKALFLPRSSNDTGHEQRNERTVTRNDDRSQNSLKSTGCVYRER